MFAILHQPAESFQTRLSTMSLNELKQLRQDCEDIASMFSEDFRHSETGHRMCPLKVANLATGLYMLVIEEISVRINAMFNGSYGPIDLHETAG